ncbi:MAG: site-specific DNA-methyltransferase, partial [Bullifex sp.]
NAEDGGHRKFIMVQLPEKCDEKSEAYKAGYKNICEIGKERIRRAGKKILEEKKANSDDLFAEDSGKLDVGFRVLKLDSSNMKDVYYSPDELDQNELKNLISNIKEGRTAEDLLFQVMLDLGVLLSSKIDTMNINGKTVFNVNSGYLMASFDENMEEETLIEIAKKKPQFFVMRDFSIISDSMMVNFDQIFDRFSPETTRKVI